MSELLAQSLAKDGLGEHWQFAAFTRNKFRRMMRNFHLQTGLTPGLFFQSASMKNTPDGPLHPNVGVNPVVNS